MARDPVCLMVINLIKSNAATEYKGRTYYFCTEQSKETFLARPETFLDKAPGMRLTVGVMGSADNEQSKEMEIIAHKLGSAIAKLVFILSTGACPGLPYVYARCARNSGDLFIGISPALILII